ncbi:MAG TPA: aminoacetone oxidase family FAD-binding enzyme [Firmicutes bacterium]|jgi:predicted Rossmann fold flavoprotein|nr:aminoacetone oxidase family FAD-binding enzyme [Bacillota bacterium]
MLKVDADLIVIGAGPAGIIAAFTAAREGAKVILLDKNKTIGRKLAITGAGRCNLTNHTDMNGLMENTPGNGRFMYSAFQRLSPEALMDLFQKELGLPLKIERGNRVFPESDKAQDVVGVLYQELKNKGVEVRTATKVAGLLSTSDQIGGVRLDNGKELNSPMVLIATGGLSYPGTGSTGDGYQFARLVGHQVVPLTPSLIPLETREVWVKRLEGLSLINVEVTSFYQGKKLQSEFGEMLFTSFGVSGPIILSLSRKISPFVLEKPDSVSIVIDLKPALSKEDLDLRVQRDFAKSINKIFKNVLDDLLPQKIIPVIIELSGIDPLKPVHQINREERTRLVGLLKSLPLTISRPRPIAEAIVTIGGVNTKEINPKTMESKIVKGLFFAGEVMDVDAYTGGFNLQIAFSTGFVAGMEAVRRVTALCM